MKGCFYHSSINRHFRQFIPYLIKLEFFIDFQDKMLVLNVYFQILIRRLQVGTEGFKGVLLLTLMIVSLMVPAIATTTVSAPSTFSASLRFNPLAMLSGWVVPEHDCQPAHAQLSENFSFTNNRLLIKEMRRG